MRHSTFLENNLTDIAQNDISKDSVINLFMRLLSINYCYNLRFHLQSLSNIFSYLDLINLYNYYKIKYYVLNFQKNYCNNAIFNHRDFQNHFSSLITFIFKPSNIGQASTDLVRAMIETEDQEFIDFIGLTLIKLKYGPWDQKKVSGRFSLVIPRKKIKCMELDTLNLGPVRSKYLGDFLSESIQRL